MPIIRLAILDVDGTLKHAESPYQFLHQRLGVQRLAATHRELALTGRISYGEWLRRDAALWAGQPSPISSDCWPKTPSCRARRSCCAP